MNCKIKSLIIVNESMQYEMFKNYFNKSTLVDCDVLNFNGVEAKEYLEKNGSKYDIITLDIQLSKKDGISVINELYNKGITYKYILISQYNTTMLKNISNIIPTIQSIFINPENIKDIESVMLLSNKICNEEELDLKSIISKKLHQLGMPAHIKGYTYTRECIYKILTSDITYKITKDLYPIIAKEYDTTSSRVERAIRHSIEVCWNRGDYEVMDSIFGNSVDFERSKPTNLEFISSVADDIALEYKLKSINKTKQVNYN